jgi:dTMP kinase
MKGIFLSLDGIDGTGKSTQCRLLVEWLRTLGHNVTACVDPGGTALGQQLRQILLSSKDPISPACESLLFFASRAQLVAEVIRPALAQGNIVVSDRYLASTLAYQGYAGGLEVEQLRDAGRLSTGDLLPGRVFILDLPVHLAILRRGRPADRLESRPTEYHEKVRQGFLREAEREPSRYRVIDVSVGIEEVQAKIREEVVELLTK